MSYMSHEEYAIVEGITLPGEGAVLTGRVVNWLYRRSIEKIAPESCWVMAPKIEQLISKSAWEILADFLIDLGAKLAESAGVNILVSDVQFLLDLLPDWREKFEEPLTVLIPIETQFNNSLKAVGELILVADSMRLSSERSKKKYPNHISIFGSWKVLMHRLQYRIPCTFDLCAIREPDSRSSGRESFASILRAIIKMFEKKTLESFLDVCSHICSVIKKGSFRNHGAVTCSLKYDHPNIKEYMEIPFGSLSHLKKSVDWDIYKGHTNNYSNSPVIMRSNKPISLDTITTFINKYNEGELFAEKYLGHSKGKKIHSNVCRGIGLVPGDKCLISNVNLGIVNCLDDLYKIVVAYQEVTQFLCDIIEKQISEGVQMVDRQIAVCPVGLANCLRNLGITYKEFINALVIFNRNSISLGNYELTPAYRLVDTLYAGMNEAVEIGRRYNMRAVIAVEPNESCARRYKCARGYTLAPNIDPPDVMKGLGIEVRHSEVGIFDFDGKPIKPKFDYGADIEVATDITPKEHYTLWNEMQKLMNSVGYAHMMSYEQWEPLTITTFLEWLYESDLLTLYYFRLVGTQHLLKGNKINARQRLANKLEELGRPECKTCTD